MSKIRVEAPRCFEGGCESEAIRRKQEPKNRPQGKWGMLLWAPAGRWHEGTSGDPVPLVSPLWQLVGMNQVGC